MAGSESSWRSRSFFSSGSTQPVIKLSFAVLSLVVIAAGVELLIAKWQSIAVVRFRETAEWMALASTLIWVVRYRSSHISSVSSLKSVGFYSSILSPLVLPCS